jgi:hypothetical protein
MPLDQVVAFYSGGKDDAGRTREEILGWTDRDLEVTHDFIQWLFPTRQRSGINPSAPLVTEETVRVFGSRPELRVRLRESLDRMLTFYGLRRCESPGGEVEVTIDPVRYPARSAEWLRVHDHNHLRLTRIMQSLAALGLDAEARALQQCLLNDVYDGPGSARISRETYEYWLSPIHLF